MDTIAPRISTRLPGASGRSVGLANNLTVNFDESIVRGSGTIILRDAAGSVIESFDAATSTRLRLAGNTLSIDPSADLAYGQRYTLELGAGIVRDTSANAFAGATPYGFSAVNLLEYVASYSDLIRDIGTDTAAARAHYEGPGRTEGRSISFDALRYTASYGDLIQSLGTDATAAAAQYLRSGMAEGRSPSFSALRYVAAYNDLIAAYGTNGDAGTEHYIRFGYAEGRNLRFESFSYTASYVDLIKAFGANADAAAEHYILYGRDEGRSTSFNAMRYIAAYSDLVAAYGTNAEAGAEHYVRYGYAEGRELRFDSFSYTASYADLIKAFGANGDAAAAHYIQYGQKEGRTISFDADAYVASYADLLADFGGAKYNKAAAAEHYLKYGRAEGRSIAPFDAASYLASYVDLRAAYGNDKAAATEHYVRFGFAEGRKVDAIAPTLTISASTALLKAGEPATITFTFSEDPGASFDWNGSTGDVTVSGGTLSAISGSGLTRTATFTPSESLDGRAASITVAAGSYTDAAGNAGGAGTSPALPVDAVAPKVSTVAITGATGALNNTLNAGDVVNVTVTMSQAVTVTGTPQLTLNIGGTTVKANYSSGSGSTALVFSYTVQAGQTDANGIAIDANSLGLNGGTLKDAAGNPVVLGHTAVVDNTSYKVDTTAPVAPEAALAADTGASNTDRVTSNGQINVTLEAGATWQYSTNSGTTWTNGTGTSFTLAAGSYAADAVQTRQTDVAGNTSTVSKLAAITVDTTAPVAPAAALVTDTGSSNTDRITSNGQVNVTVEAGAAWQYSINGGNTWTNGTGTSFTLAAGTYAADAVQTRQTDAAGNTSTVTKLPAITVDATAPAAPETALAADTGASNTDRVTSNGQINVTLEAGATWQYSTNSGTTWTNGTGTSFTLAAGSYAADAVQVRQIDVAGNTGAVSKLAAITVEGAAAGAPTAALHLDTGSSATDRVTSTGKINVSGLETGATWQYSTNSGTTWTKGTGNSFTLDAGTYAADAVQVRQTTTAGSTSAASKLAAITVDATPPGAPTAALVTDTGSSNTDRITSNGQVDVTVEAGANWQYSTNGGTTWTNGTGTSFTLAAGSYAADAVQTRQTDVAGNTSTVSKLAAITVDTTAPVAPAAALAADTGSSNTDRITSNGQVNVTVEAGAAWQYSTNGGTTWTNGTGTSFTLAAGSYAADAVQTRQTDVAGNTSTVSKLAAITVDTTAPVAPAAALAADTGSSNTDRITSNGQVNVTVEAGAAWQYSTNGGTTWTNGTGTSFTLPAGTYAADAVQTRQTDVAGNTSTVSKLAAITVDTTAPVAPAAALAADTGSSNTDRITSNGQVNVTVEAGAAWQYSTNGGTTWTNGTGTSFTLPAGTYAADAVQTRQTDVAGNTSSVTKLAAITVDTTAPATPTVTRDGTTVTVAGLEAGATWEYSLNSSASWTAGTGNSFTLAAGSYAADAVQVRQRDVAGNTATAFKFAAFTITSSLELTTSTTDALIGGATSDTINGAITGSSDTTTYHATDTINGNGGLDTFNLTLSANSTAPVSLANVSNVEKFVITGAGKFDLSGSVLDTIVNSVDASAHTGGLTLKLSTNQGFTFTGGSGDDRITAGTALNAIGNVNAGAGAGTDTLVLTNATTQVLGNGNPSAGRWVGFEKLSVEAGTIKVSDLTNSAITAVEVNGTATVTDLTAAQALNLTVAKQTGTISFAPAGTGTTDRLKISYDDGDATLNEAIVTESANGLVLNGVERLELVAKDRVDASNATLDASNTLKSVTISGDGQVSYTTNKVTTDGFTVDASAATGPVTVFASTAARSVTLTGGSGADSLVGSALADILTGGAGKDTLSGGTGADTFVFKTADIDTTAGVVTDEITDFAIGSDLVSLNFGGANAASFIKADAIDNSLADMLTLADQALNGTARYYLGQVGSDAYLVTDQDGIGYTDVIKFTGKSINDLSADMVALMDGFNDPLLRAQWYIKNVGQRAETAATVPSRLYDLNVEKAWQQGFTGKGVRVGVSDDGIDLNHTDLQAALQKNLTKNFVNQATGATAYDTAAGFTPTAEQHSHGTVVGSIVAMSANNGTGMVGIAHDAQLVSTLVVDNRANPDGNFTYLKNSGVAVSVNSYGADPAFSENYYIAPGTADADLNANQKSYKEIEDAATTGRGGLGMVVEVSAGNERGNKADAGMTGFTNSRFIIASGSMDQTGKFASYTSAGASVLVSAFGGDGALGGQGVNSGYGAVSADVSGNKGYNTTAGTAGDYAYANTGTSYSGPMVGATAALMLQANPGLGFRDVSEILAITARGVGTGNNYVTTKSTDWNMGGMHFSRDVGFGLVDVSAAVHVAQSWLKVPGNPAGTAANWQKAEAASANATADIPDNNATGLTVTANLTDNVRIERMEFDLKLNATSPSQLKAEITSAAGTTIVLFDEPLTLPTKNNDTGRFEGTEKAWPGVFQIGSTAFLGENSAGTWTLKLTDKVTGTVASYESLTVRAWGSAITNDSNYVFTNEFTGSKTLTDTAGNDTINAAAVGTGVRIDLSAASATTIASGTCSLTAGQIENAFGGMANDTLIGGAGANLLCGGWGYDALTGGDGVDTFSYALGDASALDLTVIDTITDYRAGGDSKIDVDVALSLATAVTSAGAGMATISASGVATFNAADVTLAQKVNAAMFAIGQNEDAGRSAVFQHEGDAYLMVSDGVSGLTTKDSLIKLSGVTGNLGLTIDGSGDITSVTAQEAVQRGMIRSAPTPKSLTVHEPSESVGGTLTLEGAGHLVDLGKLAQAQGAAPHELARVDITGSGDNTLSLRLDDVLDLGSQHIAGIAAGWSDAGGLLAAGGSEGTASHTQLVINADAGDRVQLDGGWTFAGTVDHLHSYSVYNNGIAQLLIDNRATVTPLLP